MLDRRLFAFVALAASSVLASVATAQVPPRIMIAVDTSGSMALDLNGVPTFGDGVLTNCTQTSGRYCGTDCTAGIDTDCDGEPNDSRMYVAAESIRNMILANGDDVDWAMSRFAQQPLDRGEFCNIFETSEGLFTSFSVQWTECAENGGDPSISSYGNPQCNDESSFSVCGDLGGPGPGPYLVDAADWPAACRPGSGGNRALHRFDFFESIDNTDGNALINPQVCLRTAPPFGDCGSSASWGQVIVAFPDDGPYAGMTNMFGLLRWIDHRETNFDPFTGGASPGDICRHASSGDCELRPIGATPLEGILQASGNYMSSVRAGDGARDCRPYSIILLTDGVETCGGNPVGAAQNLLDDEDIRTYVVGVSIDPVEEPNINAIASAGGTGSAFFASNQAALSAALASIVQDSLLIETCNLADDDCDGLVDEGVANACGGCGPPPAEICNEADEDCDGRVDEGVRNACGDCGAAPAETCNRLDDDCDGIIDEDGAGGDLCDGCVPIAERCDDLDNDCDGTIDEGLTRACGSAVGACQAGTETCLVGTAPGWSSCVGSIGPAAEECDGIDNDCDGVIDGLTRPCGSDVGECVAGTERCTMGPDWDGECVGGVGPQPAEICDNEDDDCDGEVDEDVPTGGACGSAQGICTPGVLTCMGGSLTCVGGSGPDPSETCNGMDDDCDGAVDEGVPTMGPCGSSVGECRQGVLSCVDGVPNVCVGARAGVPEICDGLDNDCDGTPDEGDPGGGADCGIGVGECPLGETQCTGGSLVCVGDGEPGLEACDTLDNDCDGLVDEGNPGGGASCGTTDVGLCELGIITCSGGSLSCVGETTSRPELCDGADNDCDGMMDEGNPEGGAACGDDTGECSAGTFLCSGGVLVCDGGVGPTAETCNGLDDDCDGVIDDGIAVGAPCGTDVGECVPGTNICRDGGLVCEGSIEPESESCDNLDNDCDGTIDEGLGVGDACGVDEGLCMPGLMRCIGGRLLCEGEVGPRREGCDCDDNDCDGTVDEAPDTGELCPAGSACVECQCALPCTESEFGFQCPTGKTPRVDEERGVCHCVAPLCDDEACGETTVERDGAVLCAPGSDDVAGCVCSNNECTFSCDGVVCGEGTVCNPRDPLGRCVENSCRGLGCPAGELCDIATGECAPDACAEVSCPSDQACRGGDCEPTCASVTCGAGERCRSGACETDPCDGVSCGGAEACDPASGECVEDLCASVRCPSQEVCDLSSGDCVADPCNTLRCPGETVCEDGECVADEVAEVDAGVDAGGGIDAGTTPDDRDRVLAAGGCSCRVGASPARSGSSAWLLALGVFGALLLRRRRGGRAEVRVLPFVAAIGVTLGGLSTGCDVDPYCLDCEEGPIEDAGADAGRDGGIQRRDAGPRDAGTDGGPDAGPCPEERCNELDDDCDGEVDEGIDTNTDLENCGACGALCAPLGAFGVCNGGACEITSCDVGRLDIDGDPANGCEYRCLVESDDDAVCDRRDNDCDTEIDEDVDLDTDISNCGACGVSCSYAHGTGTCESGTCALGACDAGFYDIDESDTNGCEYACTPADPATESCNGRDDDCDGAVDEGDPGGGGDCGTAVGECSTGTEQCVGGTLVCNGAVAPTTETCDGTDEDCDGETDEGNPDGGRVCGTSEGTCEAGRETCVDGSLQCVGEVGPDPGGEVCDGLDNDCDGVVDNGNPGGGGTCGEDRGACSFGTLTCAGGAIQCVGGTPPATESCNGDDDDCDGSVDEGNPGGGASCGTDQGVCAPGTLTCTGGSLQCVGAIGPSAGGETCNGLDDDCDGVVDDGNPGGGGSCGSSVGECEPGTLTCAGGTLQCMGAPVGPSIETCNGLDDDCDGDTDEDFDLDNSRVHCGACDTPCALDFASETCTLGECVITACEPGHVDLDEVDASGCEYACDFTGDEICNGLDDDCDTVVDEDVTPPSTFCSPNGVCAGTAPTCSTVTDQWECDYEANDPRYEESEQSCDSVDNDCDGLVDEPFPTLGDSCGSGSGACRRTGSIVCTADGTSTRCTAPPAGTPAAFESCNNADDDCDGLVDEEIPDGAIPTVLMPRPGGGTFRMMTYEASRPDAAADDAGQVETFACSNPGVLPWTNVTWEAARDACCALNPSGTCGASGWRLCDAEDWEAACEGPSASCDWSYETSCSSSAPMTCNGFEGGGALESTASSAFAMCFTDWASAGVIYDLSGNVKEWTNTETITGVHQIRGGAYNNVEDGRACAFDFTAGDTSFSFPHTGFRCCLY